GQPADLGRFTPTYRNDRNSLSSILKQFSGCGLGKKLLLETLAIARKEGQKDRSQYQQPQPPSCWLITWPVA
ncbi:MAG: hypothetical protein KJ846_04355, partial [Proteobacteria bacterium]|nr:hypothetical protein [Pseudomonadota bacterium]